ncbi:ABC transporter ATP-binding protein [Magnetospira sp. QH-2]|uniref:ABC transporter ATP-binding protein n=1 Tax=Magnetospira sp. (strain QH-2) TaxID=1288970 RepID=UPI0003E8116E|nr:ABC transporter ATP-binding protein [Magnetospira sp. QH-2]CCQ73840.1 Putative leucine/isoleucine/valine transporter subunit; ATP-binding component of ABC transporter [livG] [Magnetospira sp. QH-2]
MVRSLNWGLPSLIKIENVSKNFAGIRAVESCSFSIAEGSITGLIGPNGAGKTTLFNMVAGFYPPSSGRIYLDGRDVTGQSPHKLFHKGLVRTFQIPQEYPRMSLLENLMVVPEGQSGESLLSAWFRPGKVKEEERRIREKAEEVIEFLQLSHVAHELAGNLSGGQKKLLELGRTMMTDPRVVLLDEPGAGVNRTLLGKLCEFIQRLNRERGYTFCIIEHDMDVITRLCDPVVVMAQGTVLVQGPMEQVRHDERVLEAYLGGGASAEGQT